MRTAFRTLIAGLLVGVLGLGSAWAGAVLTTPPTDGPESVLDVLGGGSDGASSVSQTEQDAAPARTRGVERATEVGAPGAPAVPGERLGDGWFTAGTAISSLVPPEDRWTDADQCRGQAPEQLYTPLTPEGCLITFDMLWADGVDPENPIEVRAAAIGNGQDTVVLAIMDLVGYMASYPLDTCPDCGIAQMAETLSDELGIPAENFVIASTHTHAAPSTIADGPTWYYEHVRDQVLDAIRAAVADAGANPPVRVETGATAAKAFNTDRRIVNRAVPDYELGWLRAYVPGPGQSADQTILTLGNFAVHPTVRASNAQLHSGFVGPFTRRLEQQLGGTGLFFPGGLGDQRLDRGYGVNGMGVGLADAALADIARGGHVLGSNDIAVARTSVQIPVENQFFAAALASGYAIRDILPPFGGGPHAAVVTSGSANRTVCESAAPLHVVGPVSAIRLGEKPPAGKVDVGPEHRVPVTTDNVVIVQAPGEIFASISLIVKDYLSRSNNVLVTAFANDTLGYMMPANTYDLTASQGAGLAHNAAGTGNYEEALSLGRCSGEIVTKAMIEVGAQLGALGEGEQP